MNIQGFIDRKREAGAKEHEGNKTDWKDWTQEQFLAAIAGELLDAAAYAQRAMEVAFECGNKDLFNDANDTLFDLFGALCNFKNDVLEAACQEAEQEAEAGEVTGKPYAELEAELAEAKRRAAWYLYSNMSTCDFCDHAYKPETRALCNSCKVRGKSAFSNFTPAPVPDDFEVKENE